MASSCQLSRPAPLHCGGLWLVAPPGPHCPLFFLKKKQTTTLLDGSRRHSIRAFGTELLDVQRAVTNDIRKEWERVLILIALEGFDKNEPA